MHLLHHVRRERACQRLSELRRRLRGEAGAAGEELERRQLPRKGSGEHAGQAPAGGSRGTYRVFCPDQDLAAREAIARMMENGFAERFANVWIAAWNSHDLERILAHYEDEFEMSS